MRGRRLIRILGVLAVMVTGPLAGCQHAATTPAAVANSAAPGFASQVLGWWSAGDDQQLWDHSSDAMRTAFGSVGAITAARQAIAGQYGHEVRLVAEETMPAPGGLTVYYRDAAYSGTNETITMTIAFSAPARLEGFNLAPLQRPAPSDYESYLTKTELSLPFTGDWSVAWGGRTVRQNYHAATNDQRYAYDLVVVKDGVTHKGDGTKLDDYYCFNQPILAPGAGKVLKAVDGLADNPIGGTDAVNAAGNHVIIDHGNGEYSILAHLKKNSVAVKQGGAVQRGARLGVCGNSGNTSEPHLHYHLQNGPVLFQAAGLPAQFQHYVADGVQIERGEPRRGQIVGPATEADKAFRPWGRETDADMKAFLAMYDHILLVRVASDTWQSKKHQPRRSTHHYAGTVVKAYKGSWQPQEPIKFVTYSDGPAPEKPSSYKDVLMIVLTKQHSKAEIGLDTGELLGFRPDLEPALERFHSPK